MFPYTAVLMPGHWPHFLYFFLVRAVAQGSLCVRSPCCRGWSSRGAADFRSTKIGVRSSCLDKSRHFQSPAEPGKSSIAWGSMRDRRICKNCQWVKNRFSIVQIIEKNSGPRTTCFLDPAATSAIEAGGQKGDQTKESPKSCVPLFFSRKVVVRTIPVRENSGTHDSDREK